jgi:hypothetical protein
MLFIYSFHCLFISHILFQSLQVLLQGFCWDSFEQESTLIAHLNFIAFPFSFSILHTYFRFGLLTLLDRSKNQYYFLKFICRKFLLKNRNFLDFSVCFAAFPASNSLLVFPGSYQVKGLCCPFSVTKHTKDLSFDWVTIPNHSSFVLKHCSKPLGVP